MSNIIQFPDHKQRLVRHSDKQTTISIDSSAKNHGDILKRLSSDKTILGSRVDINHYNAMKKLHLDG